MIVTIWEKFSFFKNAEKVDDQCYKCLLIQRNCYKAMISIKMVQVISNLLENHIMSSELPQSTLLYMCLTFLWKRIDLTVNNSVYIKITINSSYFRPHKSIQPTRQHFLLDSLGRT